MRPSFAGLTTFSPSFAPSAGAAYSAYFGTLLSSSSKSVYSSQSPLSITEPRKFGFALSAFFGSL